MIAFGLDLAYAPYAFGYQLSLTTLNGIFISNIAGVCISKQDSGMMDILNDSAKYTVQHELYI